MAHNTQVIYYRICTPDTYIMLSADVTLIHLTFLKKHTFGPGQVAQFVGALSHTPRD